MKRIKLLTLITFLSAGICYAHTWMCQWTPDGWTWCLGSHLRNGQIAEDDISGAEWLLETQAREKPTEHLQALRAEWIANALTGIKDEEDSCRIWKDQALIVKQETAASTQHTGKREDTPAERVKIAEADKQIEISKTGVITVPAVACNVVGKEASNIIFMKSVSGGMQMHLNRLGKNPENSAFEYTIDVPKANKYTLKAQVVTINHGVGLSLYVNGTDTSVDIDIPYTVGEWKDTEPIQIELTEGINKLKFQGKKDNGGLTIKQFILAPMN